MELSWDGCVNARDLGGMGRLRPGAVVRMEAPTRLSEAGWSAVWDYGVRTVIDLRNPDEPEPDHVPRPAGLTTLNTPLDPVGTPFYEHWCKTDYLSSPLHYPGLLAEFPELVVGAVRAIANAAPGCVVFHCATGKDRTGLLSLVLLTLAEATPDEIIADYLLTYERMKPRFEEMGVRDQLGAVTELLTAHGTTFEESLTSTIATLRMPDFLLDNGLSDTDLTALRTRLTQPPVK
ncbi:tyrosine-protein phosphatase [Kutzneria sp. CA-103260]|uniref:tyrosine-protein phosphatase n=1 Tax=Kutzneria sp. CA-103260 TaxID=2802641 RepID=UPI001BACED46|nr:tyrosine-protein phosphatase [Kutzneria sp. CA-103260]QUQ66252.1 protein tyrosine/serine phosphatase [Kutzneria sp. CA-103260]